MSGITFSDEDRAALTHKIRAYCAEELDVELGAFDAGFLLDWIAREIGPAFYNQGVLDAKALLHRRIDTITEALDALERDTSRDD